MRNVKRLMILGTASNVGKGSITLAISRWLRSLGSKVAPFKTMAVGRYVHETASGDAIHVHQAQQATAAGLEPDARMNPVVFKTGFQGELDILLSGRPSEEAGSARAEERTGLLRSVICDAYGRLAGEYDFIVMEGCGSPVELNIKERDLSNLWVAETFDAPCLIVASIENVGVFGSLMGTLNLMTPAERARVVGFIINKFHGDPGGFADGVRILENRTGIPCLGVIPFLDGVKFVGKDAPFDRDAASSEDFRGEVERWTDHVIKHLDEQLLAKLVLQGGEGPAASATSAGEGADAYPNFELVWQGRIHLGDEPGVFGDAQFSGLQIELPFNIEVSEVAGSTRILLQIAAENVHILAPYPGHKATVIHHYPLEPSNVNGKWGQEVIGEAFLTSDSLDIPVDLASIKEKLIFVSLRLEVDTTVRAGLYNDFVLKRLTRCTKDFRYSTSFGFMMPT